MADLEHIAEVLRKNGKTEEIVIVDDVLYAIGWRHDEVCARALIFDEAKGREEVRVPVSVNGYPVTEILADGYPGLKALHFPDSVKTIHGWRYQGQKCSSLEKVCFYSSEINLPPKHYVGVCDKAFYACKGLQIVSSERPLRIICGAWAFAYCSNLSTLEKIKVDPSCYGSYAAFHKCDKLEHPDITERMRG